MLTIGEYINQTQPGILTAINLIWGPFPLNLDEGDYLSPYQLFLDKLMRQVPRPGRG